MPRKLHWLWRHWGIALVAEHRWSREDAMLALDLFWRLSDEAHEHGGVFSAEDDDFSTALSIDSPDAAPNKIREMAETEKVALWVGCLPQAVEKKLAEYQCLYRRGKAEGRRELQEITAQNPMLISSAARKVWKEFGGEYRFDLKILRHAVRRIIKQRDEPKKISRREARSAAMRVLYAAQVQSLPAHKALRQLYSGEYSARARAILDDGLLSSIIQIFDVAKDSIIDSLSAAAGRDATKISAVELATICAAMAEFRARPNNERAMIINEAVEIAKQFGADGGYKIVNAILHKVAKQENEVTDEPEQKSESKEESEVVQQETESNDKPQLEGESNDELQQESETKLESDANDKPQLENELQQKSESKQQGELILEGEVVDKPQLKSKTKPASKSKLEGESKPKAKLSKSKAKLDDKPLKAKKESDTNDKLQLEGESNDEPQQKSKSKLESKTKPASKVKPKAKSSKVKLDDKPLKAKPASKAKPKTKSPKAELEGESKSASKTKPKAKLASKTKLESKVKPKAKPSKAKPDDKLLKAKPKAKLSKPKAKSDDKPLKVKPKAKLEGESKSTSKVKPKAKPSKPKTKQDDKPPKKRAPAKKRAASPSELS